MKSTDDIVRIIAANGSVIVSAEGRMVSDLVRMSSTASGYESRLLVKDAGGLMTDDLVHTAGGMQVCLYSTS